MAEQHVTPPRLEVSRAGILAAFCLAGCTSALAPAIDSAAPSLTPSPTTAASPSAAPTTPEPSCASTPDARDLYGELDDLAAGPGSPTTLRVRGLEPSRAFEVWQGPAGDPPRCDWHPRDAQGQRLGEVQSNALGRLAFSFSVADTPAPDAKRAVWLVPSAGGPAIRVTVWTCAAPSRLSGRLFGEDHRPYLRMARVEARFYAGEWGPGLIAERTTTAVNGQYAFDDVPLPARVDLRVFEGDWPVAATTLDQAYFINQGIGSRSLGTSATVDFGDPQDTTGGDFGHAPAITRWDLPSGLAPAPLTAPPPEDRKNPFCTWQRPDELAVFGDGQIDNDRACTEGDKTRFRARRLPANSRFAIWQSQSTRVKFMCWPHPQAFNGVKIAEAMSDADGNLATTVKLRSIRHDDAVRETTLWLVYPDGVTTDLVATWACTRPSQLSGKLYGDDGKPFLGPVRVEVRAQLPDRVLRLTTEAVGGSYTIEDVPAPADLDLVVYQGDRRLGQRHMSRHELTEGPWGRSWRTPGFLPVQGEPFAVDFGGPGHEADPRGSSFPLWGGPTPDGPVSLGREK